MKTVGLFDEERLPALSVYESDLDIKVPYLQLEGERDC